MESIEEESEDDEVEIRVVGPPAAPEEEVKEMVVEEAEPGVNNE